MKITKVNTKIRRMPKPVKIGLSRAKKLVKRKY
jgi:hypothetical protein